jgi:hypothetical protein
VMMKQLTEAGACALCSTSLRLDTRTIVIAFGLGGCRVLGARCCAVLTRKC